MLFHHVSSRRSREEFEWKKDEDLGPDEAGELDEELELASEKLLDLLLESLPDGEKRENEVGAVGGDEVGEGRGEDVGAIPHRATAPVDELQLLTRCPH